MVFPWLGFMVVSWALSFLWQERNPKLKGWITRVQTVYTESTLFAPIFPSSSLVNLMDFYVWCFWWIYHVLSISFFELKSIFCLYIYMVCSILFSGIPFNLWLVFQGNSTKNWSVLLRQSFQGNFLKNLPENSHRFLAEDESFPSFVASQNPVFYRFPIHQSSNSTECSFFLGNLSNPTNIEPENNSQSLEDNG